MSAETLHTLSVLFLAVSLFWLGVYFLFFWPRGRS